MAGKDREAASLAKHLAKQNLPIYLTKDMGQAKGYVTSRYHGQVGKRYGFLVSSHAEKLDRVGIPN